MTSVLLSKVRPPVIGQEKMSTTEQGVAEKPPLPPKPSLEMVPENEISPKSPKLSEKPNVETSPPSRNCHQVRPDPALCRHGNQPRTIPVNKGSIKNKLSSLRRVVFCVKSVESTTCSTEWLF